MGMIKRVCFVERHAASLFTSHNDRSEIGGAEIQQYLLAREFLNRGLSVSFILKSNSTINGSEIDGVKLIESYGSTEGVRFVRAVYPRLPKLWRALVEADADLYYLRGARDIASVVAHFCQLNRRKFFHAIAHDDDCSWVALRRQGLRRFVYVHGLRRATNVLAQTSVQQRLLLENFGVRAELVRNIMPVPDIALSASGGGLRRVLWVGTIAPTKRPELLLAIAGRFPNIQFDMIAPWKRRNSRYCEEILRRTKEVPNVRHIPFVPFSEIGAYYSNADAVLVTSAAEGFPNVLLQAWSYGKPVISTYDPDGVIAQRGLGFDATTEQECTEAIERIQSGSIDLRTYSQRARGYVEQFHSPQGITGKLLSLASE